MPEESELNFQPQAQAGSPFEQLVSEDIKQFILQHNLDEQARAKLAALSLVDQVEVVAQDSTKVRNMSAVVISRAHRCQRGGAQFTAPACQEYVAGIVAKFIVLLGLDEACAEGLKALPPRDQIAVMSKDLDGVTNYSGVVDSRVRKLRRAGGMNLALPTAGPVMASRMSALSARPPVVGPADAVEHLEQAYQAFINQYPLDKRALDAVTALNPLEKLEVISQGMDGVHSPSGVVISRCLKVKTGPVTLNPRAVQWVNEVAEMFCSSYGVDRNSDAYKLLLTLPTEKVFELCSKDLSGARNPQSVMYCRIQKLSNTPDISYPSMQMQIGGFQSQSVYGGAIGGSPEVDQFIQEYKLDERAATALRELAERDPNSATEVMQQPITAEVRNPSGVIHARITGRAGLKRSGGGWKSARALAMPY